MGDEFYKHSAVARCLNDIKPFGLLDRPLPSVSLSHLLNIVFSHEQDTYLCVRAGRLVGSVNKKAVKFPCYNPAVYNMSDESYVSGQIVFERNLNEGVVNNLICHVMDLVKSSESNDERATRFQLFDRKIERVEYSNGLKVSKENDSLISVKEHTLDSMIVYRRDSSLQLKFDVVQTERSDLDPNTPLLASGHHYPSPLSDPRSANSPRPFVSSVHIMRIILEDNCELGWDIECELTEGIDDDGESSQICQINFKLNDHTMSVLKNSLSFPVAPRETFLEKIISGLDHLYLYNSWLIFGLDLSFIYPDQGLYYPMIFGDSAADVKRHYNLKKIGLAGESAIEIVRTTNNHVKRILVDEYVANRSSVLDLACGHGQDMLKYTEKDLSLFIGIDFSAQEIREARRRSQKPSLSQLPYRFHVGNMLLPESYEKFLTAHPLFDVVSVQLAIHYTLSSEEAANAILQSISKRLKPGGVFIGSCPSSFAIADRMKRIMVRDDSASNGQGGCTFGNSVYSVTFSMDAIALYQPQPEYIDLQQNPSGVILPGAQSVPRWVTDHQHIEPLRSQILMGMGPEQDRVAHTLLESDPTYYLANEMWGVPYHFWLIDHIDAVEYVVPWRAFCRVARKYGLTCLLKMPFDEYFFKLKNRKHQQDAAKFLGQHDHMMQRSRTGDMQMEVVSIYQVFVFQKSAVGVTDSKELASLPPVLSMMNRVQQQPPIVSS